MPKKLFNSKPVVRSAQPRKRSRSSTSGSNRSGRSRKRRRSGHKERNDVLGGNELSESAANTSPSVFNFGKGICLNKILSRKFFSTYHFLNKPRTHHVMCNYPLLFLIRRFKHFFFTRKRLSQ